MQIASSLWVGTMGNVYDVRHADQLLKKYNYFKIKTEFITHFDVTEIIFHAACQG